MCDKPYCNGYNSSSTYPPETTVTSASTMRCYFGEKHPTTGTEDWKVEDCQDNEDHCFQMVAPDGYESRECWDLKYENEFFAGDGCIKAPRLDIHFSIFSV